MDRQKKRRHPRYEVQDVEGTFLYNLQADVLNLSIAGMALETHKPVDVGRSYIFTIRKDDDVIKLPGRVTWCVLRRTQHVTDTEVVPIYHAGVHFPEVLSGKAHEVIRLIKESVSLDVDRRIFGRFKPETGTRVSIDQETDFAVQKISQSGMLIETSLRTEIDAVFPMEINLQDSRVSFHGRVAYISPPEKGSDLVHLGVEFQDMENDGRVCLDSFIDSVVESQTELEENSPEE